MLYRPEIDGLRAIAVVSVILFHAGFTFISGGYVGVDIFFVISGYLITTIIVSELSCGRFSLVNFYERRARRIIPALFVVMAVTLPLSWVWLIPPQMKEYAHSLMAVSTFTSNILFWHETGYWGTVNEFKPLLHTWSLAVEEQYYILFPLILMFMWRFGVRVIMVAILLAAGVSLATSQWGAYHKPTANFFLLITRGWELAVGAIVALHIQYRRSPEAVITYSKQWNELLSMAGILAIACSAYFYDRNTPFPSAYALLPTVGAALIILFASPSTMVGRFLGSRPLVAVGLISYSAYLWHQPLFAFARQISTNKPDTAILGLLALLTLPLAYLSWRYIETPFRSKQRISRSTIFSLTIAGTILFIGVGYAGHMTNGFTGRISGDGTSAQAVTDKLKVTVGLSELCDRFPIDSSCATSDKPEILVWGDSYAMHLIYGIMSSKPQAALVQITRSSCGPFFDIAPMHLPDRPQKWATECLDFTNHVRDYIRAHSSLKYVVVSSPFSQYILAGNSLLYRDGRETPSSKEAVAIEFERTLHELRDMGLTPVVVSPPPANGADIGRCLAQSQLFGSSLDKCDFNRNEYHEGVVAAYSLLGSIDKEYRVLHLDDLMCDDAHCYTHRGNTYMYRDEGHLSIEGSALLGVEHDLYHKIVN